MCNVGAVPLAGEEEPIEPPTKAAAADGKLRLAPLSASTADGNSRATQLHAASAAARIAGCRQGYVGIECILLLKLNIN